ncbi:MAG TPA: hypothetical protein DCE42_18705 [Myxococcales bacterium]|nr:hypothetical protein [Deltaproteobacteria bacterium]MBU53292.1 hypothetical protein [Deltaproteobacteria bacterium]HAA56804.1 hypothetical protein [Myxococcales bacterium]
MKQCHQGDGFRVYQKPAGDHPRWVWHESTKATPRSHEGTNGVFFRVIDTWSFDIPKSGSTYSLREGDTSPLTTKHDKDNVYKREEHHSTGCMECQGRVTSHKRRPAWIDFSSQNRKVGSNDENKQHLSDKHL